MLADDIYQADAPHLVVSSPDAASASASASGLMAEVADLDTTLSHPGSVRINVKGAFIVDQGSTTPASSNGRGSPNHHETKDIRLPNHTAVVSHIAIDVGDSSPFSSR
jgi:type II pantothenate kinase